MKNALDWLSIFGIIFEIIGFILMIRYFGKEPTVHDSQKWIEKNETGHPEWCKDFTKVVIRKGYPSATIDVPKRFYFWWRVKHQMPIYFVIFGLSLKILEIFLS